jgi:hypothetical protein
MQSKQRSIKIQPNSKKRRNASLEATSEALELTSKEISYIMQFGNYYPGFSPEWELFR